MVDTLRRIKAGTNREALQSPRGAECPDRYGLVPHRGGRYPYPHSAIPKLLRTVNKIQIHRRLRNRLLVAVTLFVFLALLAVSQIVIVSANPEEQFGVLPLGVTLGAVTGLGFVVRRLWYLYLASRP